MNKRGQIACLLAAVGLGFFPAAMPRAAAEEIPAAFSYVGSYRLVKRVKIRSGKPVTIAIPALEYRVYTDGIALRFYGAGESSGYTSFEVYRTDGIARLRDESLLENVPGVQARSLVGQVLRQVTLTAEALTLTKFPALCDAVEITYAKRIKDADEGPMNVSVQP